MATVEQIITGQQLVATNYIQQAKEFIDKVAQLSTTVFNVSIPAVPNYGFSDVVKDALDTINTMRPERPFAFGVINALSPTAPVFDFRDIDQTLLDNVSTILHADLANGGYGIDPADEAALWQRERDRETQNAMAEVDMVTQQFTQGGFSMPPGAMLDAQARAMQNAQNKISSVNRDIALRRSELYFNARKFTIEQGQSVERILVELHRAVTEQANVMTALYNSQISKYRADTDAGIEMIRGNVAIYSADISAFAAVIGAIGEAYRLKVQEINIGSTLNMATLRATLEAAQLKLNLLVAQTHVQTEAAEFGASFYANTISAALNSTNTLATQVAKET